MTRVMEVCMAIRCLSLNVCFLAGIRRRMANAIMQGLLPSGDIPVLANLISLTRSRFRRLLLLHPHSNHAE